MRPFTTPLLVALAIAPSLVLAAPARGLPTLTATPNRGAGATPKPTASVAVAAPSPQAPAPDDVLRALTDGNAAFVAGKAVHPHQDGARLHETAAGQHPIATVLSCSDSRVPAELVFDEGVGDVFSVRVAGNVADTDELGTIEYGVDHLGTPLLVVMGHTACGAVTAVATDAEVHGHIPELVDNIKRAVDRAKAAAPGKEGKEVVGAAIVENVRQSMADIITESALVRARLRDGKTKMVGAVYHLDDGKVEWLGPHPEEASLVRKADAAPPREHGAHAGPTASASAPHGAPAEGHEGAHAEQEVRADQPRVIPLVSPGAFALTAALGCLAGAISTRMAMRGN